MFDDLLGDIKNKVQSASSSAGSVKEALKLKKQLSAKEVSISHGEVQIKIRGDMKVKQVLVDGQIRNDVRDAFNRALNEVQQQMAMSMLGKGSE